jgi:hypothetical protein
MSEIKIDPQFEGYLPSLHKSELELLEKSILADGVREPIVVWGDTIVDGHNRYKIARKHDLPVAIESKHFDDAREVKIWMIERQAARRNMDPQKRALLIGKVLNDLRASGEAGATEIVAGMFNESERNVRRKGKLAEQIDKAKREGNPKLEKDFLAKKISADKIVKEIKPVTTADKLSATQPGDIGDAVRKAARSYRVKAAALIQAANDIELIMMQLNQQVRAYAPALAETETLLAAVRQEAAVLETLRRAPEGGDNPFGRDYITQSQHESLTGARAA